MTRRYFNVFDKDGKQVLEHADVSTVAKYLGCVKDSVYLAANIEGHIKNHKVIQIPYQTEINESKKQKYDFAFKESWCQQWDEVRKRVNPQAR